MMKAASVRLPLDAVLTRNSNYRLCKQNQRFVVNYKSYAFNVPLYNGVTDNDRPNYHCRFIARLFLHSALHAPLSALLYCLFCNIHTLFVLTVVATKRERCSLRLELRKLYFVMPIDDTHLL